MLYKLILLASINAQVICHTPKNTSDVIVTYAGHAEADERKNILPVKTESVTSTTTEHIAIEDEKEEVVFIPNEKEVFRNEEVDNYFHEDGVKLKDVMANRKTIGDIGARAGHPVTEQHEQNVFFITGKNKEENEEPEYTKSRKTERHKEVEGKEIERERKPHKLDCSNLECNNTVKSLCGGKLENKEWKFRLFLNECYFRKVNCGFKHDASRYRRVQKENCRLIADHYSERPYYFKPIIGPIVKPDMTEIVRNSSARRSLHIMLDGMRCPHPCPITCTNDYEPECAVTNTGERRVFVNHCKLDYNSCWNGIIWRKRPMSECVGGKKADMHQNRAFINWMQKVGIVDNKGRLSVS